MENQTNRTLAYLLANPIDDQHELEHSSGGGWAMSSHPSSQLTGDIARGVEMTIDYSVDF